MEDIKEDFFTESRKELEQYVQDRILLLKMQASEKTARLVALLFTVLMIALLGFFILLFLSIMAGYYFAGITGSLFSGFGIVAAFYVVIMILLILTRSWFDKKIINTVIGIFFDKTDEDDATS
jgi:cell division protein FtsW (lipid II flippase)